MENSFPPRTKSPLGRQLVLVIALLASLIALGLAGYVLLRPNQTSTLSTLSRLSTPQPITKVNPGITPSTYTSSETATSAKTDDITYQGKGFTLLLRNPNSFSSTYSIKEQPDNTVITINNQNGSVEKGHVLITRESTNTTLTADEVQRKIAADPGEGYPYDESFHTIDGIPSFKQARHDSDIIENYSIPYKNTLYTFAFEFLQPNEHYPEYVQDFQDEIAAMVSNIKFDQ